MLTPKAGDPPATPPSAGARQTPGIAPGATARRLAAAASVVAGSIGALVIVGWYTRSIRLITVLPALSPMQYNTALLFALAGAALLALTTRRRPAALVASAAVGVVGLATALEYVLGVGLGIDELLIHDYVRAGDAHPGRMGPNTTLAFILAAIGMLLGGVLADRRLAARLLALSGSIVGALGLVSLAGYAADVDTTYAWGGLSHMALHTAGGFAVFGAGMVCAAWDIGYVAEGGAPSWLPLPVAAAALTAAVVLAQAIGSQQSDLLHGHTALVLDETTAAIEARARVYLMALQRMVNRWEADGRSDVERWTRDAEAYVQDFEGKDVVGWVDADMVVQRVAPLQGNRALLGVDMAGLPQARAGLDAAFRHAASAMSEAFRLDAEQPVVLLCAPIFIRGESDGAIFAVLDPEACIASAIPARVLEEYEVSVRVGDETLYDTGPRREGGSAWAKRGAIRVGGASCHVTVWPNLNTVAGARTALPVFVFLVGVVIAGSSTLVVRLSQLTARSARDLERANEDLTTEVAARQESEGRLSAVLHTAAEGIITLTDDGYIQTFNPAAEVMFGAQSRDVVGAHIETIIPGAIAREGFTWMERCLEARTEDDRASGSEVIGRRQNGATFDISVALSEVAMPDGRRFTALVQDISRRKTAEQEREELLRRVLRSQEQERAKVAEELHEQIGQELTAVVYRLRAAEASESAHEVGKHVSEAAADLSVALEDVRELATDMRPGSLDLGFEEALTREVHSTAARAGIHGATEAVGDDVSAVPPETAAALYRVVRSALDNVARHARATQVTVTIRGFPDSVSILVEDDGVGFDAGEVLSGPVAERFGIFAMQERVRMLGGAFVVDSTPGEGATVIIERIPCSSTYSA